MQHLCTPDETRSLIASGAWLLLAGDEALLRSLPKGNWIGGTIPYFMTAEGGLHSTDRIFVTELPAATGASIKVYDASSLPRIAQDHPGHGFTVLLIPAFSSIHAAFAQQVSEFPGIFDRPLVGWIAGVGLDQIGTVSPKVFDGLTGAGSDSHAVALQVELAETDQADLDIVNLFVPGDGPEILFDSAGFAAGEVSIGGERRNLAAYLVEHGIDTKLPLVADYHGAMVNVSIQKVDEAAGTVAFYAPVFPGVGYRLASPLGDYRSTFAGQFKSEGAPVAFSYNCILNYAYAGLEGQSTGRLLGPMTFGEIAYMLLNQTAVHLTIARDA